MGAQRGVCLSAEICPSPNFSKLFDIKLTVEMIIIIIIIMIIKQKMRICRTEFGISAFIF